MPQTPELPHFIITMQTIKGAPLSCLLILEILRVPLSLRILAYFTGYTLPQVKKAMYLLERLGMVKCRNFFIWGLTDSYLNRPGMHLRYIHLPSIVSLN